VQTDREFSSVVQLPQFPGPSIVTRRNASPDPDQQTAETVDRMQAIAIEDSVSPQVWAATQGALIGVASSSRAHIAAAVYRWICSQVRFRSDDPVLSHLLGLDNELDLLIRPARLLTMSRPAEDCDGFTMLCCSMLLAAGVPCEIVTIKADHDEPDRFSHVYCEAILENGQTLVMDCSQGAQHGYPLGWEAPHYFDRKTWGVLHPQKRKGMHGLGDYGDGTDPGYDAIDWLRSDDGGGDGFDWSRLVGSLAQTGGRIVQQSNLPPGYALLPNGAVVPANSLSSMFGSTTGVGSISPTTLLLSGAALLAVVLIAGRR